MSLPVYACLLLLLLLLLLWAMLVWLDALGQSLEQIHRSVDKAYTNVSDYLAQSCIKRRIFEIVFLQIVFFSACFKRNIVVWDDF
ncbi:hypothetical protein QBC46DRAFT_383666 [Diplogelasinospora grovesii]|uniref:Secreted protein n=1 Tax=Diplogelasinospora grovesii TaxID=303347 RepID=A0AAN6NC89_9PEZI|nr:hypothetical protein QBC46DRAFT_383666 [Diplogelasinospora grovesii]